MAFPFSIGQVENATHDLPDGYTSTEYAMLVMESFSILAFAYGGHSVIPDVHAPLNHQDSEELKKAMMKAWRALAEDFRVFHWRFFSRKPVFI